ncbi:hypothetical protein C8R44DRAFT_983272 [Mycena epipterygia]|nr:hypothetical protein C8R44DRAFT_983272 [Mycena epipterygia]
MHRCLHIREMVDMVFEFSKSSPRTLAVLARTCTAFQNPALDILWRDQDTLMNLLRCMPSDLFGEEAESGLNGIRTLRLLRPIVASDWDRPRLYVPRVKELISGTSGGVSLAEVLPTLSMCLIDDYLFPNLSALFWWHNTGEFPYIHLFLTSKLTTIGLVCKNVVSDLSVLSVLPYKCPTLKDVSIFLRNSTREFTTLSSPVKASISMFIHGLLRLEKLNIWIPDMAALEHVGALPTLRSLTLTTLPVALVLSPSSQMPMFTCLRRLALTAVDVQSATTFLGMCVGARLQSVQVDFTAANTSEQMKNFSTALALCRRSHSTLTSLSIDNSSSTVADVMHTDSLRTLFCFGQLERICIDSMAGFDLDDAAVSDMARAWPCIKSLELRGQNVVRARATLQSLRMLARHCLRLHTFHMTFDSILPPSTDETQEHVSQKSLTSLNVEDSAIYATLPIARFLSGIFPNLKTICTAREHDDDEDDDELEDHGEEIPFHRLWKEVESQIPVLMAVREEGRVWAQPAP